MKRPEEVMEILEAFDLTGSFRQAAVLVGCDHKTVAHWVGVREATGGAPPARGAASAAGGGSVRRRRSMSWLIVRVGGSVPIRRIRSWWRWGMRVRSAPRGGRSRRPSAAGGSSMGGARGRGSRNRGYGCSGTMARDRSLPAPGRRCCAHGLAWSRYRVVVPLRDKTLPSVVIGLDRTLRRFDGVADLRVDR